MVRVFSVYQFGGQGIHRVPDDIRAACLIDSSHLALAKYNHIIEIVSLRGRIECDNDVGQLDGNDTQVQFAFPTIDEVVEMVHCKFGECSFR